MTDNQMITDNDIITALKCCANVEGNCSDCVFSYDYTSCYNEMAFYALNIINRQKVEIEKLSSVNE